MIDPDPLGPLYGTSESRNWPPPGPMNQSIAAGFVPDFKDDPPNSDWPPVVPTQPATPDPPPPDPGGRPRSLDHAGCREICALVAGGFSLQEAARYIRCDLRTIQREARRNAEFKENLRRSKLEAQVRPLNLLNHAMTTHWRASAWMLERTGPERFARGSSDAFTPRQVRAMLKDIFRIFHDEIRNPDWRKRIEERMRLVVECAIHQSFLPGRTGRRLRKNLREHDREESQEKESTPDPDVNE